MSDYPIKLDADYLDLSFYENTAASENLNPEFSVFPFGLRTQTWRYLFLKRMLDFSGALLLLLFCLLPSLAIAAAVALSTRGPVFYREWRVGRGGRPFRIWKFRSMHASPSPQYMPSRKASRGVLLEWRVQKTGVDSRITTVGRFLRRWSLDEVPQLINVLRGEMSLIGPRPVIEAEIPLYGALSGYYMAAVPGLSGLWQVSGRSNVNYATRAQLDASYVRSWSLAKDFVIMWKTLPAVLGRVGAR